MVLIIVIQSKGFPTAASHLTVKTTANILEFDVFSRLDGKTTGKFYEIWKIDTIEGI